jgi:hypothetical protein
MAGESFSGMMIEVTGGKLWPVDAPSHPVPKIANRDFGESTTDLKICILDSPFEGE